MEKEIASGHTVTITAIEQLTHNVKRIRTTRPAGYSFEPGQATEVAIATEKLKDEKRPFTFTGHTDWSSLEFIIKIYNQHDGITKQIGLLKAGDELIIGDPWGAITYKGPGTFIAGGAGVTPFIAILRDLAAKHQLQGHRLLFSNKTRWDIIMEKELSEMLGNDLINTLTDEKLHGYERGRIDADFLKKHVRDVDGHFYICGPDPMVAAVKDALEEMRVGEEAVVVEM
jgi:ferredoxin-NADP reductase